MPIEVWFLVLLGAVLLMAELVRISRRKGGMPGARQPKRRRRQRAAATGKRQKPRRQTNYFLAPREPDVMAGTLFDLLAEILNQGQMLAFSDIIVSGEMTRRYIERLATHEATTPTAEKLAFYNEAMEVNRYSDAERAFVAEVIRRRADKQYKLLEIHRNMDKIL